jgi:hypothetical protein
MNALNGHTNGATPYTDAPPQPATRSNETERPAHVISTGRVLTRIWAEQNTWGGITWRVDQYRMPVPNYIGGKYRSFHISDIHDAMRGLYLAKSWIKKAERQRTRRGFFRW